MKWFLCAAVIFSVGCGKAPVDESTTPPVVDANALAERKKLEDPYREGKSLPLDGPYLEQGNIAELRFTATSLGKAKKLVLSEDGDLLYRVLFTGQEKNSAGETLNFSFFKRSKDGTTKPMPGIDRAYMLPDGSIYQASMEGPSKKHTATILLPDGSPLHTDDKLMLGYNLVREQVIYPGTQGFSDRLSCRDGLFDYDDHKLQRHTIPLSEVAIFSLSAQSTTIGDIGYGLDKKGYITKLGIFKDGNLVFEDISIPHDRLSICASKSMVAVTGGKHSFDKIPYLRKDKNTYSRLAVPKGAISGEVTAVNAKGEYILKTEGPGLHEGRRNGKSYDTATYLVSNGKYYDLGKLKEKLFPNGAETVSEISSTTFDDRGDLVIDPGREDKEAYLLVRQ